MIILHTYKQKNGPTLGLVRNAGQNEEAMAESGEVTTSGPNPRCGFLAAPN